MPAEPRAGAGLAGRRLLIVVNDLNFLITHRLAIAEAALAEGAEVHLAAPGDAPAAQRLERQGFRVHALALSRHGTDPASEAATLLRFWRLFRRVRPDLVHLVTVKPVIHGGIAARIAGVPAMVAAISGLGYVFHGSDRRSRVLRGLIGPLYRLALGHRNARVVFQNDTDRARLTALCPGVAGGAAMIRGSGVDLDRFRPVPEAEGRVTVILPARLLREKGVAVFVAAARILRDEGSTARFAVAGAAPEGNPARIPEAEIEAWEREGAVEFWGHRDDMPEVLGQAHVVALPSYYGEGVPKVLLEAAACGRSAVTTDHPGCRDAVIDGETGLIVPPRNPAALAEALADLIDMPVQRRRMGAAARAHAERHFSVESVVAQHLALYRDLLCAA